MDEPVPLLLLRSGARLCGVPVETVVELCRPQPTEALGVAPGFVRGLTRLRGAAVPVLDLNRLLGGDQDTAATRYVSLRVGERRVALAVESVWGIRNLGRSDMAGLPPLFADAAKVVASLASLDSGLLVVLETAKMLPSEDWLARAGAAA